MFVFTLKERGNIGHNSSGGYHNNKTGYYYRGNKSSNNAGRKQNSGYVSQKRMGFTGLKGGTLDNRLPVK